jgi:hypothetical protein
MRSIYLQSFMLISLIVLELCPVQSSKCKNEQRAITPKFGKTALWFFCTALLLNEICLPTKVNVDTSCCFKVIFRTKIADGRRDGRTKRRLYVHPSWRIKIKLLENNYHYDSKKGSLEFFFYIWKFLWQRTLYHDRSRGCTWRYCFTMIYSIRIATGKACCCK